MNREAKRSRNRTLPLAKSVAASYHFVDGNNGIVFPSEDVGALARAVDEFFTTRDRAAMEAAAAASARRYSWEEYGRVFDRLVEAG